MSETEWLSVKEIADIVGVSRQTIIYYDSIDLLKPKFVDENGYRKYSVNQIMELREILFLKNTGVPLNEIKNNLKNRNVHQVKGFLEESTKQLKKEIEKLELKMSQLSNRMHLINRAQVEMYTISIPLIRYFPERRLFWVPWNPDRDLDRRGLYQTFMEARRILEKMGMVDDYGWGGIILNEHLREKDWLRGGGGCIYLPEDAKIDEEQYADNIKVMPAGEYLCMNKFGMPYERQPVDELFSWADSHGFHLIGDMLDECLLDTTFSNVGGQAVDFSQLQIQIQR